MPALRLAATNKVDDFDPIALLHRSLGECGPLENDEVVLDRYAARIDLQSGEQLAHRDRAGDLEPIAVQEYCHSLDTFQG
jgi:hypothetical protein